MSGTRSNTIGLNEPFLLIPAYQDYLWGGERLKKEYGKKTDCTPLAESWECSTHPDGPSIIGSGAFAGCILRDVIQDHPEILGTHPVTKGELPVLVKLIDAARDLSVQVHPDDDYAKRYENGSLGKSEMWYVLSAEEGARLIYGFTENVTKEEALEDGTILKHLRSVPVHANDVFFIKAGAVHAIGAGIVVAEIQESSNLTYRIYDYGRTDKDGNPRPLHIAKALDVMDLHSSEEPRQPIRVLRYRPGYASELLVRCAWFQTERILLNSTAGVDDRTDSSSFEVLLCIEGNGSLKWSRDEINFEKGNCMFLPADSVPLKLYGKAQLLKVRC